MLLSHSRDWDTNPTITTINTFTHPITKVQVLLPQSINLQ